MNITAFHQALANVSLFFNEEGGFSFERDSGSPVQWGTLRESSEGEGVSVYAFADRGEAVGFLAGVQEASDNCASDALTYAYSLDHYGDEGLHLVAVRWSESSSETIWTDKSS